MERYEIEKRYEDDEIDLLELLKTIIKERKLVAVVTILCFILSCGFVFFTKSRPHNYGVEVSFSNETNEKIKMYNTTYENISLDINSTLEKSFGEIANKKDEDTINFLIEDVKDIKKVLKEDYDYLKIIDNKNKTYKLFSKVKADENEIERISEKFEKVVASDTKILNSSFAKNISETLNASETEILVLKNEIEKLNSKLMETVKETFKEVPKEELSLNLSFLSPVLYAEYQGKVSLLNKKYEKINELREIKENSKEIFKLSGEEDIKIIKMEFSKENGGMNSKLILLIGLVLGLFIGMSVAILKEPIKNVLKEIKEEK